MNQRQIRNKCRIAIKNILKEGLTDVEIFSRPFELNYLKIENVEKEVLDLVCQRIEENKFENLKIHKLSYVLVPKKDLSDFRKCALIDIIDEITYLTLVLLIADKIEKQRINKSKLKIFSYRLNLKDNNGLIFDDKYHYTSFRKEVLKKTKMKKNKVLIECDIANYYDRINIHRIESSLLSFKDIDKNIVQLINELLLYWANRDSYGLPVGSNASRILAEAALVNVDNFLISHDVDFCRFVDDYRIFTKNASTAHNHLALLIQALNREGLFLNVHKTKMKDISTKLVFEETSTNKTNLEDSPQEKKYQNLPKIIRGYNGLIPTKFRNLSNKEVEELSKLEIDKILTELEKTILINPIELKRFIKLILVKEKFEYIKNAAELLKNFPQFIPYFIDFVLKNKDFIKEEQLNEVKFIFEKWYSEDNTPEYILIYLGRLFVNDNDKNILLNVFRNLKRVGGDYIGRSILESFNNILSRSDVLEIREYYKRADLWEKRQILRLVQQKLSEGEIRAFTKDIQIHNDDIVIGWILNRKEKFLKVTLNKTK